MRTKLRLLSVESNVMNAVLLRKRKIESLLFAKKRMCVILMEQFYSFEKRWDCLNVCVADFAGESDWSGVRIICELCALVECG